MATVVKKRTNQVATQALWLIAETDDTRRLESLLIDGADINAANVHGTTALMRSASRGRTRMVEALLEHGADPNLTRNDQFTAFLLAVFFGQKDVVKLLVQHGANVNAVSRFETSAHMWATARVNYELVDYLEKLDHDSAPPNVGNAMVSVPEVENVDTTPQAEECAREDATEENLEVAASIEEVDSELPSSFTPSGRPSFDRRIGVYSSAALFILLAVIGGVILARQHQRQPSVTMENVSVRESNAPQVEAKATAPPTNEPVETAVLASPPREEEQKSESLTREAKRLTLRSSQFVSRGSRETNGSEPKLEVTKIKEPDPTPADSYVTKVDALAEAVSTATPKPVTPRQNVPTTRPAPTTNQLLSSPKDSAPKGRVIRWP